MDATGKRYLRISGGAMAAYTAIVPVSIWMLRGHEPTPLGYSIAFLPVIPSIFARFAFMRMFRGLDQLQRRIQLEAGGLQLSRHLPHYAHLGLSAKRGLAAI